jgi:hypothetical protein
VNVNEVSANYVLPGDKGSIIFRFECEKQLPDHNYEATRTKHKTPPHTALKSCFLCFDCVLNTENEIKMCDTSSCVMKIKYLLIGVESLYLSLLPKLIKLSNSANCSYHSDTWKILPNIIIPVASLTFLMHF